MNLLEILLEIATHPVCLDPGGARGAGAQEPCVLDYVMGPLDGLSRAWVATHAALTQGEPAGWPRLSTACILACPHDACPLPRAAPRVAQPDHPFAVLLAEPDHLQGS